MLAAQRVVGALKAYSAYRRQWADDVVDAAVWLANMATAYRANATGFADKAQLQQAPDIRVVIE